MKKITILFLVLILLAPLTFLFGCGKQLEKLSFVEDSVMLIVDETYDLNVTFEPKIKGASITYSVSDPNIVYLLPGQNKILALREGQAKIYARSENGLVSEMTINVISEKISISTPTGLKFDEISQVLSWIPVLNVYSYEISITENEKTVKHETMSNTLSFKDLEIEYYEYNRYDFTVTAKAAPNSRIYKDSVQSPIYTFKQIKSVTNLTYKNDYIEVGYNVSEIDLIESGEIEIKLEIAKDGYTLIKKIFAPTDLINESILCYYSPAEVGEYDIAVTVHSQNLTKSKSKNIKIIKLSAPQVETDGESIFVKGQENESFKYFKTKNEMREEVSFDEFVIPVMIDGEGIIYEAYAYKLDEDDKYYVNSESQYLVVKKLEAPVGIKVEKIDGEKESVRIIWDKLYGYDDYDIYINNNLIEETLRTTNSFFNIATIENFFSNSGTYKVFLKTKKNIEGNIYYLPSEQSEEVKVIKLKTPELEYNEIINKFTMRFDVLSLGALINLQASYQNSTFELLNEEVTELELEKSIVGLNIDAAGIYETISYVSKESESEKLIYLDSEEHVFNIRKLDKPEISYEYNNESEVMILSWDKIEKAKMYKIVIKNITNNQEIGHFGEISESGGKIYIEIPNLEDGKDYKISIQARAETSIGIEGSIDTQYLESEMSDFEFSKLSAPIVNVHNKSINKIILNWERIDNASSYDIYIDNIKKGTTSQTIYSCDYSCENFGEGFHTFSVVAISSIEKNLPSYRQAGVNQVEFYQIFEISKITYERTGEDSKVSVDKVDYATSYELTIVDVNNNIFTISTYASLDKVYFTFRASDYFDMAGQYTLSVRAFSSELNIVENNSVSKTLEMLPQVESITFDSDNDRIIWEKGLGAMPSDYEIEINGVLVSDYDINLDQMSYSIANLGSGVYDITIIAKGDNQFTINSLKREAQVNKLEKLDTPTIQAFEATYDEVNSPLKLIFNEVDNSSYYVVYVVDNENNVIYQSNNISHTGNGEIIHYINRERFVANKLQYLYIRAFDAEFSPTFANSGIPSFNNLDEVITISKNKVIEEIDVVNEKYINLNGSQAFINDNYYINESVDLPEMESEESLTFIVRNTAGSADGMVNGTFYMASDWVEFIIKRLKTPEILTVENDLIKWDSDSSDYVFDYFITIDFYGLGTTVIQSIEVSGLLERELSYENIALMFDEELSMFNKFVGNYKIYVNARPIGQKSQKVFLTSLRGVQEFVISTQLSSGLVYGEIVGSSVKDSEIELSFLEINEPYIYGIEFEINQDQKSAKLILYSDGIFSIETNELGEFLSDYYQIKKTNGNIVLHINIQQLVESGVFSVTWRTIGNGLHTFSADNFVELSGDKLISPILTYDSNKSGNYIRINNTYNYDEHVTIYAEYGEELLSFDNYELLLPYSWEEVENIKVFAYSSVENVIKSDKVDVVMALRENVSNLRFVNDEDSESPTFDKTFLYWDSNEDASWIIYIYHIDAAGIENLVSVEETDYKRLNITNLLEDAGSYVFKVTTVGDGFTTFNSKLEQIEAIKLDKENIALGNLNGNLNWSIPAIVQNGIIKFRIAIDGINKISFNSDIYSDSLSDFVGEMVIQIKVIGDVSRNILSSNYTDAQYFYKFTTPTTFKVSQGEFSFGDEEDINVKDSFFRIVINSETYSYKGSESVLSILNFYKNDVSFGQAYAYIAGGETINIVGKEVLTLNSGRTSLEFDRIQFEIEDEEKYFTEDLNNGKVTTYFHWEWTESGQIENRAVKLYLKPNSRINSTEEFLGWERVLKGIYVDYYSIIVIAEKTYNSGTGETAFIVKQSLPYGLPASEYQLLVQKTDISEDGRTLSSLVHEAINFTQLAKPVLKINNGILTWGKQASATDFHLIYSDGFITTGGANSYHLDATFADSNEAKSYNVSVIALGNTPNEKPSSNLNYVISSATSVIIPVTKPRVVGDLQLTMGGFVWNSETSEYKTYRENAIIEFVFKRGATIVARVEIPAECFDSRYPNINYIIDDYFESVKAMLSTNDTFTIEYRELGLSNYANSEYKTLYNNIIIEENANASKEFKIAPTVTGLLMSDAGLSWNPVSLPVGDMNAVIYDIYFRLQNGNYVFATNVSNMTNLSVSAIRNTVAFSENFEDITEMFIVTRGDSEKYISSFKSQPLLIKVISGDMGLAIEEGVIKWENIEGAESYEIQADANNFDTILYKLYRILIEEEYKYYLDKYINGVLNIEQKPLQNLYTEEIDENGRIRWCWNWAGDENVRSGINYKLKVRFIPAIPENQSSATYALPGEFSNIINVYKLENAAPKIENGNLSWDSVQNAMFYKIFIKISEESDAILIGETNNTSLSLVINDLLTVEGLETLSDLSEMQIAVQAIGPSGSVQGSYYVNNAKLFRKARIKENSVNQAQMDETEKDILTWEDENENAAYEVILEFDKNQPTISKIVNEKQVNLSSIIGLSKEYEYKVYIKIVGNSGELGSGENSGLLSSIAVDVGLRFKVLPSVNSIKISEGEIVWRAPEGVDRDVNYELKINVGSGNVYVYTISFDFELGEWKIASLTKKGVIMGSISGDTYFEYVNLESPDSEETDFVFKLWSAEWEERFAASVEIRVCDKEKDEQYAYVSSKTERIQAQISKPTAPTSLVIEVREVSEVEESANIRISWVKPIGYVYYVVIKDSNGNNIYEIFDLEANEVEIDDFEFGINETYTVRIQGRAIDSSTTIKTNFVTEHFNIDIDVSE